MSYRLARAGPRRTRTGGVGQAEWGLTWMWEEWEAARKGKGEGMGRKIARMEIGGGGKRAGGG